MPSLDFLIAEFQERNLPDSTPRMLSVPQITRKAAVVIGMRRTGKTFLMYQEVQRLLKRPRQSPLEPRSPAVRGSRYAPNKRKGGGRRPCLRSPSGP